MPCCRRNRNAKASVAPQFEWTIFELQLIVQRLDLAFMALLGMAVDFKPETVEQYLRVRRRYRMAIARSKRWE